MIKAEDKVILFANKAAIPKVEKALTYKFGYY